MAEQFTTFTMRLSDSLRAQLEDEARRERRSLNQVILLRLESSLASGQPIIPAEPVDRDLARAAKPDPRKR